jgi:hypothetical protein
MIPVARMMATASNALIMTSTLLRDAGRNLVAADVGCGGTGANAVGAVGEVGDVGGIGEVADADAGIVFSMVGSPSGEFGRGTGVGI